MYSSSTAYFNSRNSSTQVLFSRPLKALPGLQLSMDPLSALGFASNIVSFVQFASGLIQSTHKIYSSATGASTQNEHLDGIYARLSGLANNLSCSPENGPRADSSNDDGPSKQTQELERLAIVCKAHCDSLLGILEALRLKQGAKKRRWKSFQKAMLEVWRLDDVLELKSRIDDVQKLLVTHICAISKSVLEV